MNCCRSEKGKNNLASDTEGKVLLVGNPNVGKSAIFTRLTGVHALSSNYPGTTIGFLEGRLDLGEKVYRLIDVPGAYTLEPTNEAEEVASRIVDEGAECAIVVLDATALERNLYLAFQVLERGLPVVVALNMVDETRHKGIEINIEKLGKMLGVPVVPTVAVTGQGIKTIVDRIPEAKTGKFPIQTREKRWTEIGKIIESVQTVTHRHHSLRDKIEDLTVNPFWGGVTGVLVLILSFYIIRQLGEGLINYVLDPLFNALWVPVLKTLSGILANIPILHQLVIGSLFEGAIDLEQSFGLLSTGLYVPIVMVLPYIVSFYAVLSFLEDTGYLPRLAIIFDSFMHRLGLHGFTIVPALLGLGCNVPGILATRVLESSRERFIAATLISIAVPCAGLQAMIIGIVGDFGWSYIAIVYATLFIAWFVIGRILHLSLKGYSPELILEIPSYRMPSLKAWSMKLWLRTRGFLIEAIPLVLAGILIVNIAYSTGIIHYVALALKPIFHTLIGLPTEAAGPIILGLLRKDVAMGMLVSIDMTPAQLVVATVTLAMTFPCIATFIVLWKELGAKKLAGSLSIMIISALLAGTLLRLIMGFQI
jgi:ferrous iron transport protein B